MISIQLDIDEHKTLSIDTDALLRTVATSVLALMRDRVHEKGKAADGSQIGTYSKGYVVYRSGAYKNAKVGKKGKLSTAGHYTKGNKAVYAISSKKSVPVKESKRKMMNRGSDPKVILSLTRQMEGDMRVIQEGDVFYIGYSNKDNFNKAIWNEQRYKKPIWKLSKEEHEAKDEIVQKFITDAISNRDNQ